MQNLIGDHKIGVLRRLSSFIGVCVCLILSNPVFSQTWTKMASYPGSARHSAAGFSIGNFGYVATGLSGSAYTNDLFQYNPASNTWVQKAAVPGPARSVAVSFELNGYGYVGLGWNGSQTYTDMHKYDPINNTWTTVASYPGNGGRNSMAASLNGKAYVGGGAIGANTPYSNQFWEYDPVSDSWSRKADLPGGSRTTGLMFSSNGLIYMGFGQNGVVDFNDLWSYDPATNIWTQKASCPGYGRMQARPIFANGNIVVGGGFRLGIAFRMNDYFIYDPAQDTWTAIPSFADGHRSNMAAFSTNGEGYFFSGSGNNIIYNDLWKLSINATSIDEQGSVSNGFSVYPNPTKDFINLDLGDLKSNDFQLRVINPLGQIVYEEQLNANGPIKINLSQFKSSYYFIQLNDGKQVRSKLISLIN